MNWTHMNTWAELDSSDWAQYMFSVFLCGYSSLAQWPWWQDLLYPAFKMESLPKEELFHVTAGQADIFSCIVLYVRDMSLSVSDCSCHPVAIITFLWLVPVNISGQANFPWVSLQKCEVLSLAFSFFIFVAVEWMSQCVMAGFKHGPQQAAAAGYVWGNPDLSSSCFPGKSESESNQIASSFFFSFFFRVCLDPGNEEV